jgi:hypothetical protein
MMKVFMLMVATLVVTFIAERAVGEKAVMVMYNKECE